MAAGGKSSAGGRPRKATKATKAAHGGVVGKIPGGRVGKIPGGVVKKQPGGPVAKDPGVMQPVKPTPVEVVRAADLLHLTFGYHNLVFETNASGEVRLVKQVSGRPSYLLVDVGPQHLIEKAHFETAKGFPVKNPVDPDKGKPPDPLELPPVPAWIAGPSRLVFKVDEPLLFTLESLLAACTQLDLVVAPNALPPPSPWMVILPNPIITGGLDIARVGARAGEGKARSKRSAAPRSDPARTAADLIALHRVLAASGHLLDRFGPEAAASYAQGTRVALQLGRGAGGRGPKIDAKRPHLIAQPPEPAPPSEHQTALEVPWRLFLSPHAQGAWAHRTDPPAPDGRVELWHSRLGVRSKDAAGTPTVNENEPTMRTVRAVWARDFEQFGFTNPPQNLPPAAGTADLPKVRFSLNSRDRMMIVHQTSNFRLKRMRKPWEPPAVPVQRLMLSTLGAWLDSRVFWDTRPQELTLEEWTHRGTMGRDHFVRVVYAGFLWPFGHRASLVKVTERKFNPAVHGNPAYLFQRMFIVVREPERKYRDKTTAIGGKRLDLVMPFQSVHITTRVTPLLDEPKPVYPAGGLVFFPEVGAEAFPFKMVAADAEGNIVEFAAPLMFMEADHNSTKADLDTIAGTYNADARATMPMRGNRVAFADADQPDDTTLETESITFGGLVPTQVQAENESANFFPYMQHAQSVIPAVAMLSGNNTASKVQYPAHFALNGYTNNAAQVFLALPGTPAMDFGSQTDRSGGLVNPSLAVSGLSRLTGPIGGDPAEAMANTFNPSKFFAGIDAKLFGLMPLSALIDGLGGFGDLSKVPSFVGQVLDQVSALVQDLAALVQQASALASTTVGGAADAAGDAAVLVSDDVKDLMGGGTAPDLGAHLGDLKTKVSALGAALGSAPDVGDAARRRLEALLARFTEHLANAAEVAARIGDFAAGKILPPMPTARIAWNPEIKAWPAGADAVFQPKNPRGLSLSVELRAPSKPGGMPSADVRCSLESFDLRLIGSEAIMLLHFDKIAFTALPGKKPDVEVLFKGVEFVGILSFVETLKDLIPLDGFQDPPALEVTSQGIVASFSLALPNIAVGVFSLENLSFSAALRVPFLDQSIETTFSFCTRENPSRLTVTLFGGGFFFSITLTPGGLKIFEAAIEFGASISIDLGVASGGVSIMAGIYFRMELEAGATKTTLTGYFRLRGEVDVLGLISASLELYLELSYEFSSGKCVGRATLTIEVEVLFFSASVEVSCERKFAGGSGSDPTFLEAVKPGHWDQYCRAFAEV